jgi:hypothetical protein
LILKRPPPPVDWEPTSGATADDAVAFAEFLTYMAKRGAPHGVRVTTAAGTWSPLWNMTLLAGSGVDRVMTMQTYTTTYDTFARNAAAAQSVLGRAGKLGIGMMIDQKTPYTAERLATRFELLTKLDVQDVWVWKFSEPLSDVWVQQLTAWTSPPAKIGA